MFEKPKSLGELAEYEFHNLASFLLGEWDGSGPKPGYNWQQFFSDEGLDEVPAWFYGWLDNFELEELVSIEDGSSSAISLCLLKDRNINEAAIFCSSQYAPAKLVGAPSYPIVAINRELLLPFVEEFLDQNEISEMSIKVWNQNLVPNTIHP
jgi:hypothetical protein